MKKKQQSKKINRTVSGKYLIMAGLALLVIAGVSYLGVHTKKPSKAASGTGYITLSPSSNKYHVGDTVTVAVQVTSDVPAAVIDTILNYPSDKLKYMGLTEGSQYTLQQRTSTSTAGTLELIRGLPGGTNGLQGTNTVLTVNFQVIGSGNAAVSVGDATGVFSYADGTDLYDKTKSIGGSYTLQLPAPTVSSVSPSTGLTSGGANITINGSNFVTGATVTIGGSPATNVSVVSSSVITAKVPAHAAGSVNVVVTNPDSQSDTLASGFVYGNPAPVISAVAPATGITSGGSSVTLTGSGFMAPVSIKIGGSPATNVSVVSSTSITATVPAHTAGNTDIVLSNGDGQTVTKTSGYIYKNPAPVISSVTPTGGSSGGGSVITISGSNYVAGATVTFGGMAATNVSVVSGSVITVTTPAHVTGAVDVQVVNPDGQSATKTSGYTYAALGDANNDGHVNTLDLSLLLSHDNQNYPPADFNHDGTIGAADLAILLSHWTW